MIEHEYKFRVMSTDVDQRGALHHLSCLKYLETARCELLESLGISDLLMDQAGVFPWVMSVNYKFIKPSYPYELLTIKSTFMSIKGFNLEFTSKIYNSLDKLTSQVETELTFVGWKNWNPCAIPDFVTEAIKKDMIFNKTM